MVVEYRWVPGYRLNDELNYPTASAVIDSWPRDAIFMLDLCKLRFAHSLLYNYIMLHVEAMWKIVLHVHRPLHTTILIYYPSYPTYVSCKLHRIAFRKSCCPDSAISLVWPLPIFNQAMMGLLLAFLDRVCGPIFFARRQLISNQTNVAVIGLTACVLTYSRSAGVAYFAAGAVLCTLSVKLLKRAIRQPRPRITGTHQKRTYGCALLGLVHVPL